MFKYKSLKKGRKLIMTILKIEFKDFNLSISSIFIKFNDLNKGSVLGLGALYLRLEMC